MERKIIFKTATVAAALVAVMSATVYAQEKYALISPGGIAFSDFKGYEDWAVVSSARTDEVLKVIVANPTMIKAYKAGVPGNGQPNLRHLQKGQPVVYTLGHQRTRRLGMAKHPQGG